MVELSPHDSSVLSRLVQFQNIPLEERRLLLKELESKDARMVGEAFLDREKYKTSPEKVRATVDRFDQWHAANLRAGRRRALARRKNRAR